MKNSYKISWLVFFIVLVYTTNVFSQNSLDNLSYNYSSTKNQLKYINDSVSSVNWTTDIDDQAYTNYSYNAIGQLTKDEINGMQSLSWNVKGLVKQVIKNNGDTLNFTYNSMGQRIKKELRNGGMVHQTFYTYYPDGKVIALYEKEYEKYSIVQLYLSYIILQGCNRIGIVETKTEVQAYLNNAFVYTREIGNKSYELYDYLLNVRAVLNDNMNLVYDKGQLKEIDTKLKESYNYYAYGMQQSCRNYSSSDYIYGYNGMENNEEVATDGNSYTTLFRQYDPRVCRWLSQDPKSDKYPSITPYNAFFNNPTLFVDPQGDDAWVTHEERYDGPEAVFPTDVHTLHFTAALIDLRTGTLVSDAKAYAAQLENDFKESIESSGATGPGPITVFGATLQSNQYEADVNIRAVLSMSEVTDADHIIVLVDQIHNNSGTEMVGYANDFGGKVIYISNPDAHTGEHEIGHVLNLFHSHVEYSDGTFGAGEGFDEEDMDIMSYNTNITSHVPAVFTEDQVLEMFHYVETNREGIKRASNTSYSHVYGGRIPLADDFFNSSDNYFYIISFDPSKMQNIIEVPPPVLERDNSTERKGW